MLHFMFWGLTDWI